MPFPNRSIKVFIGSNNCNLIQVRLCTYNSVQQIEFPNCGPISEVPPLLWSIFKGPSLLCYHDLGSKANNNKH